ncbi:hypothetical protein PanWU01x14_198640 [Parasponia andersonii]|uniref:Uncharacterized protein n=1 Tax=Parasponia andersonii TaxID=3476 RepID=A0A2P5BZ00_PARAD|nr:hypothetical protein PanWU01x14_198640 [Parasponia andersonii]
MAFIKANSYKNVPFDQWNILCDRFGSQESEGSSNMISQMKAKSNLETGEVMNPHRLLREPPSQALGDGALSAEFVVGPKQVDEFQIVSKALGTRSRWQKGLGALSQLKRQVTETITTLKQQLAEKDAEHARRIDEAQRQKAEKEAENQCWLEETQQQLNEQNWMFQTLITKLGIEMSPSPRLEL